VGTRGQLASPSDSTVEGGPGLVIDNLTEGALGNNLKLGSDSRPVHDEQLLLLVLLELGLAVGVLVGLGGG
jgi:hypothetical protein